MSNRDFVYEKFREFYNNPSLKLPTPVGFAQREFAFLLFRERIMARHKGFANTHALSNFLREHVPSDVYYSCAYYETPEAEMDKKGWAGADLVFDIDADHIPTRCNKIHDAWTCSNRSCGFSGKGITPETCPICGGVKFDVKSWPCDVCIDTTRAEVRKLVDILEKDFGFEASEIRTFFSGHRGFHVQIENNSIRDLGAMGRREIIDYVSGTGLALFQKKNSRQPKQKTSVKVFSLNNYGWNRRLKNGMRKFILNATKDDLKEIGLKGRIDVILQNRDRILRQCIEENRWDAIKGVGFETWMKIAEYVREMEAAKIDTVVTSDIHRLIRAENTLHGKTGLLKVEFPISRLDEFDPFLEAVAFKEGKVRVLISDAPEFRLAGQTFGPFQNKVVELPTAAAIMLICKDRAAVVT